MRGNKFMKNKQTDGYGVIFQSFISVIYELNLEYYRKRGMSEISGQ